MKYRKKPVVIEAIQYVPGNEKRLSEWDESIHVNRLGLEIDTLEGVMTASYGDFIIKGVQGEFYPCKPDIFGATYEEVK